MPEELAAATVSRGPSRGEAETGASEPRPFGVDDVVPRFRRDLRVARGSSAAFFDVSDPTTGRTFTLYEFELAIARMLDGRRTVAEVIASGERLGIPVDARSLYQFVRQMAQYGFLAAPGAPVELPEGGGTWGAREPWDEETRALFQSGQRLLRLGRNAEAAAYFEAVLDGHPANAEAEEMLALIGRGHSLAIGRTLDGAAVAWPVPPGRAPIHRHPAVIAGGIVGVAVLALGAIALLVPPGPAERVGAGQATPAAAPSPAPRAPSGVRTVAVERRFHPPIAEVAAPVGGELVWSRPVDAPVARGERVGEVQVPAAETAEELALARRVAELTKLSAQDPVYADFLEKARRDLADATARRPPRLVPVVAPAAGLLARPPQPGGHAGAGERLARILDGGVWLLAAGLDASEVPQGTGCEVMGDTDAERTPCRFVGRGRGGPRTEVLAEVAAADAPWLGAAGTLWLRVVTAPRVGPTAGPRVGPAAPPVGPAAGPRSPERAP